MSVDIEPTSTIVEIAPEITAVFGDIPEGLEPIDFGLLPEFDRAQLTTALSAIGNTAAITGGTAQAMTAAQGLYRVTSETQKLLSAGATMALKDGAQLGAVMRNGKIIATQQQPWSRHLLASYVSSLSFPAVGHFPSYHNGAVNKANLPAHNCSKPLNRWLMPSIRSETS